MLWLSAAPRAHAVNLILNSGFDAGLAGWNQTGTVFNTGQNAILSDQGGSRVLIFQTVSVPVESVVSLRLSFDFLNALSPQVGLGQTPDSIFGSAFTGVQPFGSLYETGVYDQAIGLVDADYRGSVNFPAGMTFSASPKGAGWIRHSVPIPVVPFVTVGFEFIEGNDTAGDSSAAFDNITLIAEPIPEPGVAGTLALAAGVCALRRRRSSNRASARVGLLAMVFFLTGGAFDAQAQEPPPPPLDPSLARATAKAERSTLDRTSGVLTSTVEVEVTNVGTRRIDGPVHALIRFRDTATGAEVRSGVTVPNALGGIDRPPHQVPYFDLSAQAAGGWEPAEVVSFTLVFTRARTLNVTYEVTLTGRVNAPPTLDPGGPYAGKVGEVIAFAATASDPDGDPLVLAWDFGDGTTADTANAEHIYATAGIKSVRVSVDDGRGGVVERDVTALVAPEGDFALAHTRVVDGVGHPVAGASVEESGPDGARSLLATESGFASLGTTAGAYVWKFSAPGHQPVWRAATLADGEVRLVPSPWLAPDGPATPVSVLEATVLDTGTGPGSIRIEFPAGAFTQPGSARLTELGPQSLPFPLPFGWSPLGAFALELPESPAASGTARLELTDALASDEFLSLVRYEPDTRSWRIVEAATAPDPLQPDRIALALAAPGAYAAVVRDQGTGAPLPAAVGEVLPAGTPQELSTRVAAVGLVDPPQKAASTDPAAVTALAQAVFTPATGVLPSSSWFRIAVQETYDLADGTALRTPDYDATVYAYRRPASTVAPADTVAASRSLASPTPKLAATATGEGRPAASFPLRPQLLFGPADLNEARLHIDVLPPLGDGAGALSAQGGVLQSGDVRLEVPAGALAGFAAGSLRALDPAAFASLAGPGQSITRAFELNLGGLVDGAQLQLSLGSPLPPDAAFALARLLRFPGGTGLAPVQRFRTDTTGRLLSSEPATPPRLPGLSGPGQYLLVQLPAPQGLVTGQVTHADATPAPGIGVRIAAQPWLSVTNAAARFDLLAPAGSHTALASHPTNGDGAAASLTMGESLEPVVLNLTLGALPPRLLASSPPDGATKVSPVAPITLEFSEKLAPASLGATPVALRAEGATSDIPGGATLDLSGRFLTFLPTVPLAPGIPHTVTLGADLRDLQGLALDGPRSITFSTAPPAARGQGAQLTIYEPGATGATPADQTLLDAIPGYTPGATSSHVAAIGSPGSADPEVPVILVNESTGATATVLSKPDGSFANFIEAEETDFVSATFVNTNGTRVTIPATKQKFDDGRTGLYRQGGILEAESDGEPAEIIVEPGAVPTRTVFTLEEVGLSEVKELLNDVEPEGGGKVLGGLRYAEQGDPITLAADVVFPLKPGDIPDGVDPANATFALTMPMQIDGVNAFQIIDAMSFEPVGPSGRLVTRSPPFIGLLLRQINAIRKEAVFTDTFNRVVSSGFGSAASEFTSVGAFLIPILAAPVRGQKVAGKVVTLRHQEPLTDTNAQPLAGAFVRLDVGLGAASTTSPGLFRRGETFSMSSPDGRFAFHMPDSFNRRLVATHPRFPFQRAASGAIVMGELTASTTLIFRQPPPVQAAIEDTAAPVLTITQSPAAARAGQGENDGALLTLTAADDIDVASLRVQRDSFLDTTTGAVKNIELLLPPTQVSDSQPAPGRLRHQYRLQAAEKGTAIVTVHAADSAGNLTTQHQVVVFGEPAASVGTPASRRLTSAWPPHGASNQPLGIPIRLRFSLPLDPSDLADLSWITLSPPNAFTLGAAEASDDRRELTLRYFVQSGEASSLTLSFDSRWVNQVPGNPNVATPPDYSIEFAKPPALTVEGGEMGNGAGVVMMGGFVYCLDRQTQSSDTPLGGELRVHQITSTGSLTPVQTEIIPERPSDIVAIPAYPLREFDGTVRPPESYLAVFSGAALDVKRLSLYRIQPDGRVVRALNARPPISLGISQVVKAKWDPPFLAFQELTSENTSISLINLNALYIGFRLSQSQPDLLATLPRNGRPGTDLNNDGDFADQGETAPLPASRDGQVFGLEFSWAPLNPAERLRDFDFSADFGLLGGVFSGPGGNGLVMVLGGGAQLDESTARLTFQEDPKRVLFLPRLSLLVGGEERVADVALISTVTSGSAPSTLLVADVTNPAAPSLIGKALLPAGSGTLNTIIPREDGLLAVSTTSGGILLLDPRRLLEPNTHPEPFTAAVIKQLPNLQGGGERSFTADTSGLSATAGGTALRTAIDAPLVEVNTFDLAPFTIDDLKNGQVSTLLTPAGSPTEEKIAAVLATARRADNALVFPALESSPATDLDPRRHYYVTVRAPGVLGPTLELAAAAVDAAGNPTVPTTRLAAPTFLGNEQFTARFVALAALNAIRTIDLSGTAGLLTSSLQQVYEQIIRGTGDTAKPSYATDLLAHRLSGDPTHPLYNTYLAGPIVVLSEDLDRDRHTALQTSVDRRYLAATHGLWVGLSPTLGPNHLLHPFASRQDENVELQLNAGLNLQTLLTSLGILADLVVGNKLAAVQKALRFVDAELERTLQPGVSAYLHLGAGGRNPLIFVPGVMASGLSVPGIGPSTDLWVPVTAAVVEALIPFFSPLSDLILTENSTVVPTDVLRSIAFGQVDIQDGFLSYLRDEMGLGEYSADNEAALRLDGEPNWDSLAEMPYLFPFPYDWRKDNAFTAERLEKYVDLILAVHADAQNVDVVAHSMGGLVARRYMTRNPGKIGNFISIASPFLGAPKAVATMKTGDLGELALNMLIPSDLSIRIARRMPALHQLMPNRGMFQLGYFPIVESGWDITGDGKAYTKLAYEDYKEALDGPLFRDFTPDRLPALPRPIEANNEPFHTPDQFDWRNDTSGTRIHHIVAVQQLPRTVGQLELVPAVVPSPTPKPDIGLAFPPVRHVEAERPEASTALLNPEADLKLKPGDYELSYSLRTRRTAGDGTVPFLSATRGYGAGAAHDLNAPRAVMAAIVSEGTSNSQDKSASHVDVLHHPKLLQMVDRILTRGLSKDDLPTLAIVTEPATPIEGELVTFTVDITGQIPADDAPIVVWETGDGRTLNTRSGAHTYGESGTYTLSCAVYFPKSGIGTVASKAVTVANAPPVVELVATPATAAPGQTIILRVDRSDTGFGDEHRYDWSFDGTPDPRLPSSAFLVRRSHQLPGTYSATVTVTDDDGASATATTSYTVSATPVAPLGLQSVQANLLADPPESSPSEFLQVIVSGHDTSQFATKVFQDGSLIANTTLGILMDFRALVQELNADGEETLTVFRETQANGSLPGVCSVRVTAGTSQIRFRVRHVPPGDQIRSFVWEVAADPGQGVTLTLPWAELATLNQTTLASRTSPAATVASVVASRESDAPVASVVKNPLTGAAALRSEDRAERLDATQVDQAPLALVDTVPDDDPTTAFDERTTLEGAPVTVLANDTQDLSTLPTGVPAIVATDSRLESTVSDEPAVNTIDIPVITESEAEAVRQAARRVFREALPIFRPWVISMDDLLILEQGSGASLWKGDLAKSAYIKGVSDNDYEILLPAFKNPVGKLRATDPGVPIDFDDDSQQAAYAKLAHLPDYLEGDWYFAPPVGVDAEGNTMGAIPNPEDEDAYEEYRFTAQRWRYRLPVGINNTLGGTASGPSEGRRFFDVTKGTTIGNLPLFDHPATPADIIAAALTHTAKSDPQVSAELPEVTFFPVRREHFFFGTPSVERPPPFGDDPIGDAGLGRGLLFLKWVLEGVFINPFANDPTDLPLGEIDLSLRTTIHERLRERQSALGIEGYEWGLLQEYVLLRESAHLIMEQTAAEAAPANLPDIVPDGIASQENKIIKKVGKSVIRAVFGRLMADPAARSEFLAVTPQSYDADAGLRTFEHLVARVGANHPEAAGLQPPALDLFLGAKLGDSAVLNLVRAEPEGFANFVEAGFEYLKSSAQVPLADTYADFLDSLLPAGRINEFSARSENARIIDHGIVTEDGDRPGRADLHGLEGNAVANYSFNLALHKRGHGENEAGPVDVALLNEPGDSLLLPNITIPANRNMVVLDQTGPDGKPFFTVRRPITSSVTATHEFALVGPGLVDDSFSSNNFASFESRFLDLTPHFLPRFRVELPEEKTRWIFRGLRLTDVGVAGLETLELERGVHESAAVRNGLDVATRVSELSDALTDLGDFSDDDVFLWSEAERAALAHVGGVPPNSPAISTAEKASFPLTSGLVNNLGPLEKAWLLVMEVPVTASGTFVNQGIEYLATANGGVRRINDSEGNEVVYIGEIRFLQAHLFQILPPPDTQPPPLPAANVLIHRSSFTGNP